MKRIVPLAAALALFIAAAAMAAVFSARAESYVDDDGVTHIDTNWWFENVCVEIDVRRDKTFAVKETMQVGFIKGDVNTGIIRDIQRVSRTIRIIDGKEEEGEVYIAKLSDVSVSINGEAAKVTQSLYDRGQFHSVKMQLSGDRYFPSTASTNEDDLNTFVLEYVYDMSDDKAKGYDDFTFDVFGYAMDFTRNFQAKITFPDTLDISGVSFRTNKRQEFVPDEDKGESVSIVGNTVELTAKPNKEHVGYTVQVLFDDGYFTASKTVYWYYFIFALIAFAGIIFGGLVFLRHCNRAPVETVEFYPPEGMRALRFSAIWHGRVRGRDIAAVIAQWADEGYVRIYKDGGHNLIVRKIKDMPVGADKAEKDYFDTMFSRGAEFSTRSDDFEHKRNLGKMFDIMKGSAEFPDPLHKSGVKAHIGITASMVVPFIALFVYFCILFSNALPLFFLIFITAGAGVGAVQAREKSSPMMYVFPLMFTALPLFIFIMVFYIPMYDYAGLIYIAPAWYVTLYVMSHFMSRRSDDVMVDYGRMAGFKRFLLTAEKSRLEMLFEDDPDYFSHIIPYCLIMGIGKKVEQRFAALDIAVPDWADGMNVGAFSGLSRTLASSSGGGSSGSGGGGSGGSSGGGGGGGGSRGC